VKRLILCTALVASVFPATAASAVPPVTVLSPETLTVPAAGAPPVEITLRNDRQQAVTLHVETVLGKGTAEAQPSQLTVEGFKVKSVPITVTADNSRRDTTGELVLATANAPPAVLPLVIEPEKDYDSDAALLIVVPLLVAAVLVGIRVATVVVNAPFGPANWDYSQSWATSLTLVGALLGTVLGAGVLPDNLDLFSAAGYSEFNVLFGMLVLVAPLVYVAAQRRIRDADDKSQQYEGTTWAFALASVVTLWGVFGELATVGLLFREIEKAGGLGTVLAWVSLVALGVIVIVVTVYTMRRMRQILESPGAAPGSGLAAPDATGAWSLL
jgi:hypothetical protein